MSIKEVAIFNGELYLGVVPLAGMAYALDAIFRFEGGSEGSSKIRDYIANFAVDLSNSVGVHPNITLGALAMCCAASTLFLIKDSVDRSYRV